jgi:hypothetical protein
VAGGNESRSSTTSFVRMEQDGGFRLYRLILPDAPPALGRPHDHTFERDPD